MNKGWIKKSDIKTPDKELISEFGYQYIPPIPIYDEGEIIKKDVE